MEDIERRLTLLEAEVQRLKDHQAICQVIARYGPLADSAGDDERRLKAGAQFAEDGVYDLGEDWKGIGPAGIAEILDNPNHRGLVANGAAHVMAMPYILIERDVATALSYSRVYRHEDGRFIVSRVSINHWRFRREDDGWKVAFRKNRLLNGSEDARMLLLRVDDVLPA